MANPVSDEFITKTLTDLQPKEKAYFEVTLDNCKNMRNALWAGITRMYRSPGTEDRLYSTKTYNCVGQGLGNIMYLMVIQRVK